MPMRSAFLAHGIFTASDIRVSRDGWLATVRLSAGGPPVMLRRGATRACLCEGCGLFGLRDKPACPDRVTMHCSTYRWQLVPEEESAV